jgi:hypothetical protein
MLLPRGGHGGVRLMLEDSHSMEIGYRDDLTDVVVEAGRVDIHVLEVQY